MSTPSQIATFKKFSPDDAADVLEWNTWSIAQWSKSICGEITEGDYDDHLAEIVLACHRRMASVFKSPETKTFVDGQAPLEVKMSVYEGMREAARLVKVHGLIEPGTEKKSLGVTRTNYAAIIAEHGAKTPPAPVSRRKVETKVVEKQRKKKATRPEAKPMPAAKAVAPKRRVRKTIEVEAKSIRSGDLFRLGKVLTTKKTPSGAIVVTFTDKNIKPVTVKDASRKQQVGRLV